MNGTQISVLMGHCYSGPTCSWSVWCLPVTLHEVSYSSSGTSEGSCDKGMGNSHALLSLFGCQSWDSNSDFFVAECLTCQLNCFYALVVLAVVHRAHFLHTLLVHLGYVFYIDMFQLFLKFQFYSCKVSFGLQYISTMHFFPFLSPGHS